MAIKSSELHVPSDTDWNNHYPGAEQPVTDRYPAPDSVDEFNSHFHFSEQSPENLLLAGSVRHIMAAKAASHEPPANYLG